MVEDVILYFVIMYKQQVRRVRYSFISNINLHTLFFKEDIHLFYNLESSFILFICQYTCFFKGRSPLFSSYADYIFKNKDNTPGLDF